MRRPLRTLAMAIALLTCCVSPLRAASAETGTAVPDAQALRTLLLSQRTPARLEPLTAQRGCINERSCMVQVGGLVIGLPTGRLRSEAGRPVQLRTHAAKGLPLPPADWQPLETYRVSIGDQPWGLCMVLAHTGLGRSGSAQRWASVVLVPMAGGQPGRVAHRFVGYWAACDQLWQAEGEPGRVALPLLVRAAHAQLPDTLAETPWVCSARDCLPAPPARHFVPDPKLPGGGLRWLH